MTGAKNTMRTIPTATALAMLVLAASPHDAGAQVGARNVTVGINVSTHKPNGDAWDAFGGAPDIALCVSSAFGTQCYAAGPRPLASPQGFGRARCQDAFSCSFTFPVPTTGPFSIVIYDVDVASHDQIGSCVVTPPTAGPCGSAGISANLAR